jgi:hypothetical protein
MGGSNGQIRKGFILKARAIEDSEVAHAPPHVREVWDLILRKANFRDRKCNGTTIKRGQWLSRIPEIRELLYWTVGARKEHYETHQIENAMKWLRSREMVATAKAARGLFITVVNFDLYQVPEHYECRDGSRDGSRSAAERKRRKGKNGRRKPLVPFVPPTPQEVDTYAASISYQRPNLGRDFCQRYEALDWCHKDGEPMDNWKLTVQGWRRRDEARATGGNGNGKPREPQRGDPDWLPSDQEADEALRAGLAGMGATP